MRALTVLCEDASLSRLEGASRGVSDVLVELSSPLTPAPVRAAAVALIERQHPHRLPAVAAETSLELLTTVIGDWEAVEAAQVCLEIFGRGWALGLGLGDAVGGDALRAVQQRMLVKARRRLRQGSNLAKGTSLWNSLEHMCHICATSWRSACRRRVCRRRSPTRGRRVPAAAPRRRGRRTR